FAGKTFKVDSITGTAAGKLDLMVLTGHPDTLPGSGTKTLTVTQWAAVVTFTAPADPNNPDTGTWYQKVTIPVVADPWFDIAPGHENFKAFPKRAHRLDGIRGPLAVEGGTTSADRSLRPAILLPGE